MNDSFRNFLSAIAKTPTFSVEMKHASNNSPYERLQQILVHPFAAGKELVERPLEQTLNIRDNRDVTCSKYSVIINTLLAR